MPSEKAMQTAEELSLTYARCAASGEDFLVVDVAKTIDAHTAAALEEYQRVLDECEKALLPYAQLGGPFLDGTKADPVALSAFAAITKLKGKQG